MNLTFKEIKEKCSERETVLINNKGEEFVYLGTSISGDRLVTQKLKGLEIEVWHNNIEDWNIRRDPMKLYAYKAEGFVVFSDKSYPVISFKGEVYNPAPEYDIEYK